MIKNLSKNETSKSIFKLQFDMHEKGGLKTLFEYRYFTFPIKKYNDLGRNKEDCHGNYTVAVAKDVKEKYSEDSFISEILNTIDNNEIYLRIFSSPYRKENTKGEVIRCEIDYVFLQQIKKLFISTIAHIFSRKNIPEMESIEFTFDFSDLEAKTVSISSLNLYTPLDNPFFEYARNNASFFSFQNICSDKIKPQKDLERRDFYRPEQLSKWKTVDDLDKETAILGIPGIYMLYNSNNNNFYIGKSINLYKRIKRHHDDENDPQFGFTHYRYSSIQSEYFEVLDLIENAAIHDVAWILNMPKSKRYNKALSTFADINNCLMTNKIERQTNQ